MIQFTLLMAETIPILRSLMIKAILKKSGEDLDMVTAILLKTTGL